MTRFLTRRLHLAVALALAVAPWRADGLRAQAAPADSASPSNYQDRYRELIRLRPTLQVADVSNLVLTRDVGRLILTRGKLYLLTPVGGRTVAVVFEGEGRFSFAPAMAVEQEELRRFAGSRALDEPFTDATLLFADSTADQLRALTFASGDVPGSIGGRAEELINSLKRDNGVFDSDVMGQLLNGQASGMFMARIRRVRGDPVLFWLNPAESESVQLLRPVSRRDWGASWNVVSRFPARVPPPGATAAWDRRQSIDVPGYVMELTLNEALNGNIGLAASARFTVHGRQPSGPWLVFDLDGRLELDSVRVDGAAATFFKADEDGDAWVNVRRRLQPGDTASVVMYYHGGIVDRYENWFFVSTYASWYPVNRQGRVLSTFDLTFRSPAQFPLASVGTLRDSSTAGRVRTTHWVTQEPTRYASFNLGLYENYAVRHPDAPPLDVLISTDGHRTMRQRALAAGEVIPEQRNMKERVAEDVSNALRLFTTLYGPPRYDHFYITEVPYPHGVSFPGLMHLSWATFQETSLDGFDEYFRAHEVAHQWWGNGVRPESYRDWWLAEGLSTFAGLTYLRFRKRRDTEYFRFLDRYRNNILSHQDVGPISIGTRASSPDRPRGYHIMTYEKGAWVFQMLRMMMMDLRTLSPDAFTATMREFYQMHQGRAASTEDFQRLVEERMGQPMGWFFDQWVRSSAVPRYRVAWGKERQPDGRFLIRFRIRQENVPAEFRMPVLVAADLGNNQFARFRLMVTGGQTEYVSPPIPGDPRQVVFNDLHSVLAEVENDGP